RVEVSWADVVVAGGGVVVFDDGQGIGGEHPESIYTAADPWGAIGLVLGHQAVRQRQRGGGVVEGAAAQAGPAALTDRFVQGDGAAVHCRLGVEHVGNAAAFAVAPAIPLGLVVVEDAVADGDHACREEAI